MPYKLKRPSEDKRSVWKRHSLSIVVGAILGLWIILYMQSSPNDHWGAFYGNAIADWSGLLITIITTKFLYELGSRESRRRSGTRGGSVRSFLEEHSLSLFFIATGLIWLYVYACMSATSKWGQVVGNILSEWTQILGVILLTKEFFEIHSKE